MADIRSQILWQAADQRLKSDRPFIIAITGSIAKTSTKEAVGAVLRHAYTDQQVRVGYGNLNTELGLPLAILGFELDFHQQRISWQWPFILIAALWRSAVLPLPKYLVVEMAADKPGDLRLLTKHIHPDIGIVTFVGEAHLQNYQSLDQLAAEKGTIIEATRPNGLVLLNRRDPYFSTHLQRAKSHVIEFDCETSDIAYRVAELVGKHLGIPAETVGQALLSNWQPEGRLQHHQRSFTLIDDSYNASPTSMKAALDQLAHLPSQRVAILGSMLELGANEVEYHQEIGQLAHQKADYIIGVGELARYYQPDKWYATSDEAAEQVVANLKDAASILVKGSHGINMRKIAEALKR